MLISLAIFLSRIPMRHISVFASLTGSINDVSGRPKGARNRIKDLHEDCVSPTQQLHTINVILKGPYFRSADDISLL